MILPGTPILTQKQALAEPEPGDRPEDGKRQLGEWLFEPELNRITRPGESVHLEPQLAKLLNCLIQAGGHVLSKDEIIATVWDNPFVADSALSRAMAELRKALGDDAHHPRFIQTIPKRGYRWLAPNETVETQRESTTHSVRAQHQVPSGSPSSLGRSLGRSSHGRPSHRRPSRSRLALSILGLCALVVTGGYAAFDRQAQAHGSVVCDLRIAVLPFANLTEDPGQDYFAEGMTEAVTTHLARVDAVSIISRRSVEFFHDKGHPAGKIADALGVDAIVEGSVLKSDGRVRVTVQLTDGDSDAHIWAQSYERRLSDVLRLQSDVAGAIAKEIGATLTPGNIEGEPPTAVAGLRIETNMNPDAGTAAATLLEPTEGDLIADQIVDPRAYELFLKGRHQLVRCDRDGPNEAARFFQRALEIDPTYAQAYAGLALYYAQLAFYGHLSPEQAMPLARAAADRALELDDGLGEAYMASAVVRFSFDWDWQGAESDFRRALELNPGNALLYERYAFFLTCLGRFDEALVAGRRAVELDPLNSTTRANLGWVHFNARQYQESLTELRQITELDLADKPHSYESWSLAMLGDFDQAIELTDALRQKHGPSEKMDVAGVLGWIQARAGLTAEAHATLLQILEQLNRSEVPDTYGLAIVYAGLGETTLALDALEQAFAIRSPNLIYLKVEPFLQDLTSEPRYQALQARTGLGPAA